MCFILTALSFSSFYSSVGSWKEGKECQESSGAAERQEKALYDTASVRQINLIKELRHSMAESRIIIPEVGVQVYNVVMV